MIQETQMIKEYEAEIETLKDKNRNLLEQINERVQNYVIYRQSKKACQKSSYNNDKKFIECEQSSVYKHGIQEGNSSVHEIFDKNEIKNLQKITKIDSLIVSKKLNLSLQKAIDLKLQSNGFNQVILKDSQIQHIPTQQDSINLDDQAQSKTAILKQKDLQIEKLNNKIEELNLKLEKSQMKKVYFQEQLKIHQSQRESLRELDSMKSLIDQLESNLKYQQQKNCSSKQIKETLQKQNFTLKIYIKSLNQNLLQASMLKDESQKKYNKLKQNFEKQKFLRQQFFKMHDKLRQQKQIVQNQLLQRKKLKIITEKYRQEFECILNSFQKLLQCVSGYQGSQISEVFQNLKEFYQSYFKKIYYCTINLKENKEKLQKQLKCQNNMLHLKYKNIISLLISKQEQKLLKYQQYFNKTIKKLIKHHSQQQIKINTNQFKLNVKKSQGKNKQIKITQLLCFTKGLQEQEQIQSIRGSSHTLNLQSFQSPFDNENQQTCSLTFNKQSEVTKIQELQYKIQQINRKFDQQKSGLYKRLHKVEREFKQFMNHIILNNSNLKILSQKTFRLNSSIIQNSFLKQMKQKIYQIAQLIPLQGQQDAIFYPQACQQIIQMLDIIQQFFQKYQIIEQKRKRQNQRVQESILSLIIKFIRLYDITQDDILQQLKYNDDINNLKNWIHQYYQKKTTFFKKKSEQLSSSLRLASNVTFGIRTNSQMQQFDC